MPFCVSSRNYIFGTIIQLVTRILSLYIFSDEWAIKGLGLEKGEHELVTRKFGWQQQTDKGPSLIPVYFSTLRIAILVVHSTTAKLRTGPKCYYHFLFLTIVSSAVIFLIGSTHFQNWLLRIVSSAQDATFVFTGGGEENREDLAEIIEHAQRVGRPSPWSPYSVHSCWWWWWWISTVLFTGLVYCAAKFSSVYSPS